MRIHFLSQTSWQVVLNSLHRYQPRIHVVLIDSQITSPERYASLGGSQLRSIKKEMEHQTHEVKLMQPQVKLEHAEGKDDTDQGDGALELCTSSHRSVAYIFAETQFIAVTAYQNEEVGGTHSINILSI